MMGWIIFGILFLLFIYILFAPLYIYLNTTNQEYQAGLPGFIIFKVIPDKEEIVYFRITVLFIRFKLYPFRPKAKEKSKKVKPKKVKKKGSKFPTKRKILLIFRLIKQNLKSFRITKFYLNIDTDNVTSNAFLIPVFSAFYQKNINLNVNYTGDNELIIRIENTVFHLLSVTIRTFIQHKRKV